MATRCPICGHVYDERHSPEGCPMRGRNRATSESQARQIRRHREELLNDEQEDEDASNAG